MEKDIFDTYIIYIFKNKNTHPAIRFIKLINNINSLIDRNKENITTTCSNLPAISKNAIEITDNVKGIAEVATEATAEAIVAKDNLLSNYETIKDIINIIASIFIK